MCYFSASTNATQQCGAMQHFQFAHARRNCLKRNSVLHMPKFSVTIHFVKGGIFDTYKALKPCAYALKSTQDSALRRTRLKGFLRLVSGRTDVANGGMSSPHPIQRCAVLTSPARELTQVSQEHSKRGDASLGQAYWSLWKSRMSHLGVRQLFIQWPKSGQVTRLGLCYDL
jgi:hypothetical protein